MSEDTSAEPKADLQLEIAHLLLIDVVGYSTLLVNEQIELLNELKQIVRSTDSFRSAETHGKLIRVPTGDGMALVFFRSPEEPAKCALEIAQALKSYPHIQLRMGVHSGPINQITDVNDRSNVAGSGINVAQRVMDCGDAGHILLSKHVADDLAQYRNWRPHLHELGECEAKHGLRLHVVNLYKETLGNPQLPQKLRRGGRWKRAQSQIHPVRTSSWPKIVLGGALLLSAIALVSSLAIFFQRPAPTPPPTASATVPEKSIAVLPFENLSDDKQNAYFADGMQDEIITDLAKVSGLKVISRTSVMQYKAGTERNLREIGRQLGVAHVLEGAVRCVGNRVRVNAQLIDARTDAHIWAERYESDIADVFTLETELAEKIVSQLKTRLSPEEKVAIQERPTADLVAYDLYLRAKSFVDEWVFNAQGTENLFQATRLLDQAVTRDPNFFLAFCQLAHAHDLIYVLGLDHSPARLASAETAVKAAMRLRPDSGEARLAQAEHLYFGYMEYERAREELSAALSKLPNNPLPFLWIGSIDRRQGRWDDAIKNYNQALEFDPRNINILRQLAVTYGMLRRFPAMANTLDRALKIAPGNVGIRVERGLIDLESRADPKPLHAVIEAIISEQPHAAATVADAWIYLAFLERDRAAAERAISVLPPDGCRNESLAFPRAWCEGMAARTRGDNAAARAAFQKARGEVEKTIREQPDYAEALSVLGMVNAALGRKEEAVREGRRAVELLPVSKDSINGALLVQNLAIIYAWAGKKDLAFEQLRIATEMPGYLSYGQLRLHPYWDPLRKDPRFEKIVASLAPKE